MISVKEEGVLNLYWGLQAAVYRHVGKYNHGY